MNNHCPFINSECRSDCVFKTRRTSTTFGTSSCLIAIKLDSINDAQMDQLTEISQSIAK